MSRRDLFLMASTAAISSLLTYLYCTTMLASPGAVHPEISTLNPGAPAVSQHERIFGATPGSDRSSSAETLPQPASQPVRTTQPADTAGEETVRAIQKQKQVGEQISSFFKDEGVPDTGAINAKLENRFYQEEWNQEWAGSKERSIRTLFEADQDLGGLSPQIACRSKNCQVVLAASSQEQVQQLSAKFMQAATRTDVGMKDKVVSYFPDISTGRVVFYLSENGNTDLFQ